MAIALGEEIDEQIFLDRFMHAPSSVAELPRLETEESIEEFEAARRKLGYLMIAGVAISSEDYKGKRTINSLVRLIELDPQYALRCGMLAGPYLMEVEDGRRVQVAGLGLYQKTVDNVSNV